ncbi:MAG: roadblock/LC7 domain-containing protein [Methanoregulaceae archaeon]|nr:roadblock/LC7 domain-containing protein [Methanoregulaceae archaeon]
MADIARSSTDILKEISGIKGVNAVVVVGRDGFVIESNGHMANSNLDMLGAAVASAINGISEMGKELSVGTYSDLFVNYKQAMIMCFPVGDAICGIAGEDSSTLGLIRHKTQKLIPELERLL